MIRALLLVLFLAVVFLGIPLLVGKAIRHGRGLDDNEDDGVIHIYPRYARPPSLFTRLDDDE